jgi:rare lipoprotein A
VNARRPHRHATTALLGLVCAGLALPAAAVAVPAADGISGGGGLAPAPVTLPATGAGGTLVSVSGDGVSLSTTSTTMLRRRLGFIGTASGVAGRAIEIEREGRSTDWIWTPTVQASVSASGAFTASWATDQAGQFAVRAIVASPLAAAAEATPSLTVTVYRRATATFYGPGFYGRRTACGGRLTPTTIGVANRTLPCGAPVSILYHGRTLTVPVIDRGPYANGADWDLTLATAEALGMPGIARIGAVALPSTATG